jgi:hypothetical protein
VPCLAHELKFALDKAADFRPLLEAFAGALKLFQQGKLTEAESGSQLLAGDDPGWQVQFSYDLNHLWTLKPSSTKTSMSYALRSSPQNRDKATFENSNHRPAFHFFKAQWH